MRDQFIEDMLRTWGKARRKINGTPTPPKSIWGRIVTEGKGAAIRSHEIKTPEVMLNEALIVSRAIRQAIDDHALGYDENRALHLQYVAWCSPDIKAKAMGVRKGVFYSLLDGARNAVNPYIYRLSGEAERETA